MIKLPPVKGLSLSNVVRFRQSEIEKQRKQSPKKLKPFPSIFEEFCKSIKVKSGGRLIPFELYEYQRQIHQSIVDNKFTQIVKTRQTGLSELALFELAFYAVTNPAFTGIFISHREKKEVVSAAKKFRHICEQIEKVYGIRRSSKELFAPSFEGGGQVLFRSGLDPDNAVGESSVSMIVYDEAALYDFLQIMAYAEPCMTMLGERARTLIISTPRLKTDDFGTSLLESNPTDMLELIDRVREYKVHPVQEVVDEQGWHKFIVHWKAHPIYGNDPDFLDKKIKESKNPKEEVLREYDLCFDILGETMFSHTLIHYTCRGEWEKKKLFNCDYYIGIDPQFGGADYAVCQVFKHDLASNTLQLVDWYRKNFAEKNYHLTKICELIDKYNPEAIAIEVNNGGEAWLDSLQQTYPERFIQGIRTMANNKAKMITRLVLEMEDRRLILPDISEIKKEFSIFQKKGNILSAPSGKHDDIVMAAAIATNILPSKNELRSGYDFSHLEVEVDDA